MQRRKEKKIFWWRARVFFPLDALSAWFLNSNFYSFLMYFAVNGFSASAMFSFPIPGFTA